MFRRAALERTGNVRPVPERADGALLVAFLLALAAAPAGAVPPMAENVPRSVLVDRDYVELETGTAPEFMAFWARFRAAVASDSRDALMTMVASPLVWGDGCIQEAEISVRRVFSAEARAAFEAKTQLVTSRAHPGKYFSAVVRYRDAGGGMEEQFEFERFDDGFRLVRVGTLDVDCAAAAAVVAPAPRPATGEAVPPPVAERSPEPDALQRWFHSNRELFLIAGLLLYQVAGFRVARAGMRSNPELRRRTLLGSGAALCAAAVVGFYLPSQVPGGMWEGFFKAGLYVAAGFMVMLILPALLAAVVPMRRDGARRSAEDD